MRRREEVIQQAHALLSQGNAVYSIPTIPFQYQNDSCKLLNAINHSLQEKIELLKRGGLFVCWDFKQIHHFFILETTSLISPSPKPTSHSTRNSTCQIHHSVAS